MAKASKTGMSSKEFEILLEKNPKIAKRMQLLSGGKTPKSPKKEKEVTQGSILQILQNRPKVDHNEPNDTEKSLARELQLEKLQGNIRGFHFEEIGLKIAPKTWYFPDFIVFMNDGSTHAVEVKGFLRDDAAAKFKVAVGLFPHITFHMVRKYNHTWKQMYNSLLKNPIQTDGKNCRITR